MQLRVQLFLAGLMCLSSASLQSQGPKPDGASLEIVDTIESPSVCHSRRILKLQTIVLNTGTSEVAIDARQLDSSNTSYSALIDTEQMKYRMEGIGQSLDSMGSPPKVSWINIPPDGFYRKEIEIPLHDKFFDKNGYYKILLSSSVPTKDHGWVSSSHSFIFEIHSCEP